MHVIVLMVTSGRPSCHALDSTKLMGISQGNAAGSGELSTSALATSAAVSRPFPANQPRGDIMMEEWNKNRSLRPDHGEPARQSEDESAKRREREARAARRK